MTVDECDYARRMLLSVIFGAIIGFERKSADRPAGIRTMGLVSLGSCFFTMCSMHAFRSSTMNWDAARVSAAIPSGVGFLGAGLIWKGTNTNSGEKHEVHGLATAAGLWLSAAIGVGVGGKLYVPSAYAVVLVVLVLRLGPRLYFWDTTGSDGSTLYSDGMGGWDGSESNKDEETEDELDYDPYNESNNLDFDSIRNILASTRSAASFVTEDDQKWLLVKDSVRYGSKEEEQIPSAAPLDKRSNNSLPPENSTPLDESVKDSSNMNIPDDSTVPSHGNALRKVPSQPILKFPSKWTGDEFADESKYHMRRVKTDARYLTFKDDDNHMSLRKSRNSMSVRSVRRKTKYDGPTFVD